MAGRAANTWQEPSGDTASIVIGYGILVLFWGFALLSLASIVAFKRLTLTTEHLSYARPLIFYKRHIRLAEIERVAQEAYQVSSSHDWNDLRVYYGKQTAIHLVNGEVYRFSSFEIGNYHLFTACLQNERRRFKHRLDYESLRRQDRSLAGFGWLVFILALTGGLLYALWARP